MFDLFRSRDKAVRYLLGALLMLVALSMVITLIPGFGSGGGGQNETVVAVIGDEQVTLSEVQRAIANMQRSGRMQPEMFQIFVPQMVDQMITERAMALEASRLGFEITEADTVSAIRTYVPQLFQDGKFVGKETYSAFLEQQGTNIQEFEANVTRQALLNRVRAVVTQGVVVSPVEIEQEFRKRNERATIEYAKVTTDKFRSEIAVTEAEIAAEYNRDKASFRLPERRSYTLLVLNTATVQQQNASLGEAELRKMYEAGKDRFRTGERVHVRHILLKTTDKPKEEQAKIRTKAEELLKQIRGGADFAALAKANSEDTGSAVKGGDLDWVVRGQSLKAFEEPAFSLKPKDVSNVVQTEYGFHILQVLEKQEAHLKTFEEVQGELKEDAQRQKGSEAAEKAIDALQAAVRNGIKDPEKVAAELRLGVTKIESAAPGTRHTDLTKDLDEAIHGLPKGGVTPAMPVPLNKYVVGVVTAVIPAGPAELKDVAASIRARMEGGRAISVLAAKGTALLAAAKQSGDLKKAAQAMGLEYKAPPDFTRNGAVEGVGTGTVILDAFTKPIGEVFGPIPAGNESVIAKVVSRTEPNLAELGAQRDAIREEIRARKTKERVELFEDGLREHLIKQGKIKINQDVLKNLLANYRG